MIVLPPLKAVAFAFWHNTRLREKDTCMHEMHRVLLHLPLIKTSPVFPDTTMFVCCWEGIPL